MGQHEAGELIVIGGGEDKRRERRILKAVSRRAQEGGGPLVVITAATQEPERLAEDYVQVFEDLGVADVAVVDIRSREEAHDAAVAARVRRASVVFFTGGSQLRIASQLGGSAVCEALREAHAAGATVAGTSAGAAVLPDTMLTGGSGDESARADDLDMAPGLRLLHDVVVDTHFAQRGRIGRLLAAVVQNPRNRGVGIDEDTAIVVGADQSFRVLGSGAVYVVDGGDLTYSSLEHRTRGVLSAFGVRLHVLSDGEGFDWPARRPQRAERTE
jgi:cyanophycinase